MLFNSIEFLLFFPIVLIVYFALPYRFRWAFLLVASYIFYMSWQIKYASIMMLLTIIDYFAGLLIERAKTIKGKRLCLSMSIGANLTLLFFFKYYNFFSDQTNILFQSYGMSAKFPVLDVLLPLGISFHTFQAMSYTIDVYRGRQKAERHFGRFALFIAYFPQLVAGPIERSQHLMHQLREDHDFDYRRGAEGTRLMFWGFFKKLVIADNLAVLVDRAYNAPHDQNGWFLLLATYCFAFQIFCDFSGYTDIARGAAQIMGVNLMENFQRPYFSKSVPEFWKRWHISLSSWFRDYVYIPICGSRNPPIARRLLAVMAVFMVSGLWHGANWTFVVWGALNGIFYLLHVLGLQAFSATAKRCGYKSSFNVPKFVQVFITFNLICITWVFFRANSVRDGFFILRQIFQTVAKSNFAALQVAFGDLGWTTLYGVIGVLILVLVQLKERRVLLQEALARQPVMIRWAVYFAIVYGTLLFGNLSTKQFIYFQF